jgi:hypothetical protein
VFPPESGSEQGDVLGRVGIDSLEHIDQVGVGIDALDPTGGEQTLAPAATQTPPPAATSKSPTLA